MDLKIQNILNPEVRLMAWGVSSTDVASVVVVYTLTGSRQPNFFRRLEVFQGKFRSLILVGGCNTLTLGLIVVS